MKNCLLISNETEDHLVTLYIYSKHDPICWLSHSSIIIRPGHKEYYETGDTFRYEVATKRQTSKKAGTLIPVQTYTGDKHIIVKKRDDGESCQTVEEHLDADNQDKRICIRRRNLIQQSNFRGGRDLYEILQLDMKKVRKQSTEEQNRMIKRARDQQIRRWHPDHNPENADENIAKEINFAFAILHDPESRARYNNAVDYDGGWLSKSRWRAIFWPHCETEEQKRLYRQRMLQIAISSGLLIGGLVLGFVTAGLAIPVVVPCALVSGALAGAGLQSGLRTLRRDCIENGCDWKTYGKCALIGGAAGAAVGGAGVGFTAAIAGLASTAATATAAQGATIGVLSGAAGGGAYGLANEIERINVHDEEWTVKQVGCRMFAGAVIGGLCGAVAGAVAGKLAPLAAATETDALEMAAVNTGAKRLGISMAKALGTNVSGNAVMSVGNSVSGFIEERADDTRENQPLETHLKGALIDVGQSVTTAASASVAGSLVSHVMYEQKVKSKVIQKLQREGISKEEAILQYESMTQNDQETERRIARVHLDVETKADSLRWTDAQQRPISIPDSSYQEETNPLSPVIENSASATQRILFISQGLWKSEMIIKYKTEGVACEKVLNHGESFYIPSHASDIAIQFKVLRFTGMKCDLKKWDRFHDQWYSETHVLHYQTPQTRTFTIGGGLYYEKILKITNELYDETNEL